MYMNKVKGQQVTLDNSQNRTPEPAVPSSTSLLPFIGNSGGAFSKANGKGIKKRLGKNPGLKLDFNKIRNEKPRPKDMSKTDVSELDYQGATNFFTGNENSVLDDIKQMLIANELEFDFEEVDSVKQLKENDLLVISKSLPSKSGHSQDLSYHSSFRVVKSVSEKITFQIFDMKEGGGLLSRSNYVGPGKKHDQSLTFNETSYDENSADVEERIKKYDSIYRARSKSNVDVYDVLLSSMNHELSYLEGAEKTYGSEYKVEYNCNTFVRNVLARMNKVSDG